MKYVYLLRSKTPLHIVGDKSVVNKWVNYDGSNLRNQKSSSTPYVLYSDAEPIQPPMEQRDRTKLHRIIFTIAGMKI
jgi:hypothetical protein